MSQTPKVKKPYRKPKLKNFGSVKDLTKTSSQGGPNDGGAAPFDRMGTMGCVSKPPFVLEHRNLVTDVNCQTAFAAEIQKQVRPGDVVVDLGCGSGIHTLFALRAGARKVYAIESGPAIHMARAVIEANGYKDQVEFVHEDSRHVNLPELGDVLISNIGFLYSNKFLADARRRLIKADGKMIPSGAEITIVPYMDENFYNSQIAIWSAKHFGFDFSAIRPVATHHPQYLIMDEAGILAPGVTLPKFDFSKELSQPISIKHQFRIHKAGTVHGLAGWYTFESSGAPLITTLPPLNLSREIWSNFILPLEKPITVKAEDTLKIAVTIDLQSLPETALWFWTVETDNQEIFNHSSLFAHLEPSLQL